MEALNIAMIGPEHTTPYDEKEITDYLDALTEKKHRVVIFAHHALERIVFKYFVQHLAHANLLTVYTYRSFAHLPDQLKIPLEYLVEHGAQHKHVNGGQDRVTRAHFSSTWTHVIEKEQIDMVVSFYDGSGTHNIIPVDIAKSKWIRSIIYYLPGEDIDKHQRNITQKIRTVHPGLEFEGIDPVSTGKGL